MDTHHISVKTMTLIVLATAIWEEPGAAINVQILSGNADTVAAH